jgi:hypothetical protein
MELLYRYSVILTYEDNLFLIIYKDFKTTSYTFKKEKDILVQN